MVNDAFYVLMAALYVGSVLAAAGISLKTGFWREEETRKYVHVSVSFTAFIIAYCISSPLLRLIGPVAFIFINAYSGYKTKARLGGLLLYPVSLALLAVAMNLGIISQSVFVTSILVMGLGDGGAAVVGMRYGTHRVGSKTLEGSLAMFIVSFVLIILSCETWYWALLSASLITVVEALSPHGWDNFSVPVSAALLLEVL